MARPVVRWASGVVGCGMGMVYTPILLEMMRFAWGEMDMAMAILVLVVLV